MAGQAEQQTIDMGTSMETEEGLAIIDNLNAVTDVLAMAGSEVKFLGTPVTTLTNVGQLAGVDVFSCPRGWFILFRVPGGPHWSVAGSDASEAVAAIDDDDLREVVRQQLLAEGLL
ncbi:MAG: hypothetical protein HY332_22175 [Chloroflexi bacterium]|nr:hypothetical protein [Chloroflexota bacterium]